MKIFSRQSPNITLKDFKAVFKTVRQGKVFQGPLAEAFERRLAEYIGVKYVVLVNMGRTAELVALEGLNFSKGDEIIVPSYNFPIVPIIVKMLGLKPVFVDVDPDTFNIDPCLIENSITPRTKAILITHMCGHPCEMDKIVEIKNKYGLRLIEDGVHSLGAEYKGQKVGTFGDVGYFSFYVGKAMTTFMGAAVCTNDKEIFERMKNIVGGYARLSVSGLLDAFWYGVLTYFLTKPAIFSLTVYPVLLLLNSFNSQALDAKMEESLDIPEKLEPSYLTKFTNFQAAAGLSQVNNFENSISQRINNSLLLNDNIISGPMISTPIIRPGVKHSFLYYFLRAKDRKQFRKRLIFKGVDTKRDSNKACSHLDIFKEEHKYCPISESISEESILIPNYPLLSEKAILYIAKAVNQITNSDQD